jgi:hypothetical protein
MRQLFVDLFGEDKVSGVIRNMKFGTAAVAYSSKKVITGHFDFMPGDRLPPGYLSATVLRDPRERALSLFYFQKNDVPDAGLNAEERMIKNMSLDEALHHETFINQIANTQAVHFASFFHPNPILLPPAELLSLAQKGLEQYHLVGVTEQIEEFAEVLKTACDSHKPVSLKYKNVTSVRKAFKDLSPALQNRIDALTEVDRELWHFAKSRFEFMKSHPDKFGLMFSVEDNSVAPVESCAVVAPYSLNKGIFELQDVQMISQLKPGTDFISGEWIELHIAFRCLENIEDLTIGYSIHHDSGLHIFGINTRILGVQVHIQGGGQGIVRFSFPLNVGIGSYYLNLSAHTGLSHLDCCYMLKEKVLFFNVVGFGDVNFEGLARLVPRVNISAGDGDSTELLTVIAAPAKMQVIGQRSTLVEQPRGSLRILVPLENIKVGTQMVVPVAISNESEVDWVSGGTSPVFVSYHWHSLDGVAINFDGIRTPLPQGSIASGAVANGIAFIETPLERGDHVLEITIMQEGFCWFEECGFQSAQVKLSVI